MVGHKMALLQVICSYQLLTSKPQEIHLAQQSSTDLSSTATKHKSTQLIIHNNIYYVTTALE